MVASLSDLFEGKITGGVVIRILSVHKSALSPSFERYTTYDRSVTRTYDLIVTDGITKGCITLHPDATTVIECGLVKEYSRLLLLHTSIHTDVTSGSIVPRTGIIVFQYKILESYDKEYPLLPSGSNTNSSSSSSSSSAAGTKNKHPPHPPQDDIVHLQHTLQYYQTLPWSEGSAKDGRPLLTGRLHYLPFDSDDFMNEIRSFRNLGNGRVLPLAVLYFFRQDEDISRFSTSLVIGNNSNSGGTHHTASSTQTGTTTVTGRRNSSSSAVANNDMENDEAMDDPGALMNTQNSADGTNAPITIPYPIQKPTIKDILTASLMPVMRDKRLSMAANTYLTVFVPKILNQNNGMTMDDLEDPAIILDALDTAEAANADPLGVLSIITHHSTTGGRSLPLIGRISGIGRIIYYGTPNSSQRMPFRFEFQIMDGTRSVQIVCWNGAAAYWYQAIRNAGIGTVIAILRYRVKTIEEGNGRIEVSINPEQPGVGTMFRLPDSLVPHFPPERFPIVPLRFQNSKEIFRLPQGSLCSFAGIVSKIGPLCRSPVYDADVLAAVLEATTNLTSTMPTEPTRLQKLVAAQLRGLTDGPAEELDNDDTTTATTLSSSNRRNVPVNSTLASNRVRSVKDVLKSSGQYGYGIGRGILYTYRWIGVRDGASSREIAIKLYSNSNFSFKNDEDLQVGVPIILHHLRILSTPRPRLPENTPENQINLAFNSRPLYAISSENTTYLLGTIDKDLAKIDSFGELYPHVQDCIQWYELSEGTYPLVPSLHRKAFVPSPSMDPSIPSLVRPPNLEIYINLMIRGAYGMQQSMNQTLNSSFGWNIPIVRPQELEVLRRGHIDLVHQLLVKNNKQNILGVVDPAVAEVNHAILTNIQGTEISTSNVARTAPSSQIFSALNLARDALVLQKYQTVRVIVIGKAVHIRDIEPSKKSKRNSKKSMITEKTVPAGESNNVLRQAASPVARRTRGGLSQKEEQEKEMKKGKAKPKGKSRSNVDNENENSSEYESEATVEVQLQAPKNSKGMTIVEGARRSSRISGTKRPVSSGKSTLPETKRPFRRSKSVSSLPEQRIRTSIRLSGLKAGTNSTVSLPSKKGGSARPKPSQETTVRSSAPTASTKPSSSTTTTTTVSKTVTQKSAPFKRSSSAPPRERPTAAPEENNAIVSMEYVTKELHDSLNAIEDENGNNNLPSIVVDTAYLNHKASMDTLAQKLTTTKNQFKQAVALAKRKGTKVPTDPPMLVRMENELQELQKEQEFGTPVYVLRIQDSTNGNDYTDILMHSSRLLPHYPPIHVPNENDGDPGVAVLRNFFPPHMNTKNMIDSSQYILGTDNPRRKFAFCLVVERRNFDEVATDTDDDDDTIENDADKDSNDDDDDDNNDTKGRGGSVHGRSKGSKIIGKSKGKTITTKPSNVSERTLSHSLLKKAIIRIEAIYEVANDGTTK